jgi:hypothetical protein
MQLAVAFLITAAVASAAPVQPLPSGQYTFEHRYAEQPSIDSIKLTVTIKGDRIYVANRDSAKVFPLGEIDSGRLMWHAQSKQWIVGHRKSDRFAPEVGGCSDGPSVIDLARRIYWTC